jgi:hypothetical protein
MERQGIRGLSINGNGTTMMVIADNVILNLEGSERSRTKLGH